MTQTMKRWMLLVAAMSVFSAMVLTSCKDGDDILVAADNKPWTISADDSPRNARISGDLFSLLRQITLAI